MASSTNDPDHRSHINPPLPTIRPQPQPGHAGSSGQGTSSQVPRGRAGELPHHPIQRDAYHPYKSWPSGPGPARDLALPQVLPSILPSTSKPTGGLIPETTADANKNNIAAEEVSVVSDFYRSLLPRVTELLFRRQKRRKPRIPRRKENNRDGRKKEQCDARELRHLVQRWKGLDDPPTRYEAVSRKNIFMKRNDAPDPIYCVAVSYSYIQSFRSQIYGSPRLVVVEPKQQNLTDKVPARAERARRMKDRLLFEAVSQYYQMPGFMKVWGRPQLIRECKHGYDHSSRGCHSTHLHPSTQC